MAAMAQPSCERIIDRYAIYEQIAAGGMAVVHFGRLLGQAGFSRTVAVKRLHPQFAADPEFVAMFLDEARLAVRVQHPNVVAPLDVVVADGELLVVMDYVSGETLSQLLRCVPPGTTPSPAIVSSVLVDSLYGLHAAHEASAEDGSPLNMVHRDVSPQNIIVGVDGVARVLDFGIAKAAMRSQATKDGEIKGKISYMAPEQLRAHPVDRRADIFAAGVVLWEALTGHRLFRGEDLGQAVERVLHAEVPKPSEFNPDVPAAVDTVVLRALERKPDRRFAGARDFAVALESAIALASPSEVADWVRRLGGNRLAQRIQRVAAIESHSSSRMKVTGRSPLDTPLGLRALSLPDSGGSSQSGSFAAIGQRREEAATVRPDASDAPQPSMMRGAPHTNKRALGMIAGSSVALVVLAVALFVGRTGSEPKPATPAAIASPPPAVLAQRAAAATLPEPSPESSSTVVAPTSSVAAGVSAPAAPPKHVSKVSSQRVTAPAPGQTTTRKAAASNPNCNPPYVLDARGIRRVKPECLR